MGKKNPLPKLWEKVVAQAVLGDLEETLYAIQDYLLADAAMQSYPSVKSCLESAAEHVGSAAMDYYVSLK